MTTPLRHARLATLPNQARRWVRVTGEDAGRFLQGLLTADVAEPTPGRLIPAALLTVKGKIISEVWVLADSDADERLLGLPSALADEVIANFDAHIIMDDVELEPLELDSLLLWREGGTLRRRELDGLPSELVVVEAKHPLAGVLVLGSEDAIASFVATRGEPADADAFTAERVAQGCPAWGFELQPDHFPPEVGFVDAVSYDKGCYMGQEPLSRIHNRGQVNHVMVRVHAHGGIEAALPVELTSDTRTVGRLTSLTRSGDGLAIVRRASAVEGTALQAGEVAVEVRSGPLGDDPGGPGRRTTATVKLGGR